jgi:hypothetical protein
VILLLSAFCIAGHKVSRCMLSHPACCLRWVWLILCPDWP